MNKYKQNIGFSFYMERKRPNLFLGLTPFFLTLVLTLSGCSYFTAKDSTPGTIAIPKQWQSNALKKQHPVHPWLNDFSDSELNRLVEEALIHNPTIQSLLAGVSIAQDQTWFSWSALWPKTNAGLKASRNKRSNAGGFSVSSTRNDNFGFALDFLWEIDLWYKLGNELEATEHEKTAAESDLQAAQLSLAANIAKTWFNSIVARQQVKLADKTIKSFNNALEIIEQGYIRGLYQALDVRLARTNLFNAKGKKENFLKIQDQVIRTLESLLGRYPSAKLLIPGQLPTISTPIPNSVPASLLGRRPDIIAAAERFFASDQRLLKARKNMLPTIQLSGSGGTSTQKVKEIFNPEFLIWNLVGNLTQPLFHGTQLFAERSQAEARVKQAAANYAQVVLQAFQEVETTMAAEQWLVNQEQYLNYEVEESLEAKYLAEEAYIMGLTDIITLLDAQRRAFDSESSLLETRKQRLQNRVNLYLALGGPVFNIN